MKRRRENIGKSRKHFVLGGPSTAGLQKTQAVTDDVKFTCFYHGCPKSIPWRHAEKHWTDQVSNYGNEFKWEVKNGTQRERENERLRPPWEERTEDNVCTIQGGIHTVRWRVSQGWALALKSRSTVLTKWLRIGVLIGDQFASLTVRHSEVYKDKPDLILDHNS